MNILFQHTGPLPVLKYGGTERIIFWLMKELVRQGHNVYLIGHPHSKVKEYGIQLIVQKNSDDWREQIPSNIDVAHLFYTPAWPLPCHLLVTIEGNGQPGEVFHPNTVFVSAKHAELHGSQSFVYNGLDIHEYPFTPRAKSKWDNFLFLAKAQWKVKNLSDCVRACRQQKKHLAVAGGR